MEDFVIASNLSFKNEKLESLVSDLKECFKSVQQNFSGLCKTIYSIWSYCKGNYFASKDNEYYNSYKLLEKFGFSRKSVGRYKSCYEKFIDSETCAIRPLYKNFSPSKLFELLQFSKETADNLVSSGLIAPEMTVKTIREHVKNIISGQTVEPVVEEIEINEEEIPMAYDPKQEYEFSYFESKTKNQLLNIVWQLQKEYQKLKNKGAKKNDNI